MGPSFAPGIVDLLAAGAGVAFAVRLPEGGVPHGGAVCAAIKSRVDPGGRLLGLYEKCVLRA